MGKSSPKGRKSPTWVTLIGQLIKKKAFKLSKSENSSHSFFSTISIVPLEPKMCPKICPKMSKLFEWGLKSFFEKNYSKNWHGKGVELFIRTDGSSIKFSNKFWQIFGQKDRRFLNGPYLASFLFIFPLSKQHFTEKTVFFSVIRTRIVGSEGKHADHKTTNGGSTQYQGLQFDLQEVTYLEVLNALQIYLPSSLLPYMYLPILTYLTSFIKLLT